MTYYIAVDLSADRHYLTILIGRYWRYTSTGESPVVGTREAVALLKAESEQSEATSELLFTFINYPTSTLLKASIQVQKTVESKRRTQKTRTFNYLLYFFDTSTVKRVGIAT